MTPQAQDHATVSTDTYDVAVLGGGAAGLSAAVFSALRGARVILIERTEYLGGLPVGPGGFIDIAQNAKRCRKIVM